MKLLNTKYNRVLELIEENGKIPVQTIEDGDFSNLQKELKQQGYISYLDPSTDYLICEKENSNENN